MRSFGPQAPPRTATGAAPRPGREQGGPTVRFADMDSSADRIRRVLSDGAAPPALPPAPPRLREVAGPAEKPPLQEPATLDADLRKRLEALGVGLASGSGLQERRRLPGQDPEPVPALARRPGMRLGPPAEDFAWADLSPAGPREDPAPLETLVGATQRATPHGSFLQVERCFPLTQIHGRLPLADALAHPVPLRAHERGPGAGRTLAADEAAFIDTETTGLAGGTGTVAFLIGAGWIERDTFLLRQYFMRDYPDEAAVLHALEQDLGTRPLVSFNGRSFDWPLLTTRWQMNRTRPEPRAHFDLLTAARRLWSRTLHSHSLATLERYVLGLERGEDLPGYMIPTAWFDFVRSGWGGTIAQAFRHNEIDVVSMLTLFARVGAILEEPIGRVEAPEDRLGTARLLLDIGDPEKARGCLEAGLPDAGPAEGRGIHRLLGHLCRRNQEWQQALVHWMQVAESGEFDAEAYEQVAKLHEHRLGDPHAALRWTTAALEQVVEGTRQYEDFAHRAARLERKLARQEAPER